MKIRVHRRALRALLGLLCGVLVGASARPAVAQPCDPQWGGTFAQARLDGAPASVFDMIEFDFGQGARLVAGGNFRSAGTLAAENIARSTPTQQWEAIGPGLPGTVWCLEAFNDGGGLKLYAGGFFGATSAEADSGIRRWNGTAWESIGGPDGSVSDMLVWNDGTGSALYVAGSFVTAGGVTVNCLAKWNGLGWSAVGGGITGGYINKLCLYDSSQGPRLVIGGNFFRAGTVNANGVALWSGTAWSAIPQITGAAEIVGLGQYQKPGVRELWIASTEPGQSLRRWDGTALLNVSLQSFGLNRVLSITQATEGGEQVLVLGGNFTTSNLLRNLVKWNGSSFAAVVTSNTAPFGTVYATCYHRFAGDAASRLAAAGVFTAFIPNSGAGQSGFTGPVMTTTPTRSGFQAMAATLTTPGVRALAVGPSPGGDALYAGGYFAEAFVFPDMPWYFARWQYNTWNEVTPGLDGGVQAMVRYRGDLIVGGSFGATAPFPGATLSYVARFDGNQWHAMPGYGSQNVGFPYPVQSLAVAVEGGNEYVYATLLGTPRSVARWDGTAWTSINALSNTIVYDVASGDLGGGAVLFGAGSSLVSTNSQAFAKAGATSWESVAPGQRFGVGYTVGIFDLGDGPQLVGGGIAGIQPADQPQFTTYYPVVTVRNGRWEALGTNLGGTANALAMFDDGDGPALYAAGDLRLTGVPTGQPNGRNLAKWNGAAWELVGGGLNGTANALLALEGPARLLIGGAFSRAGETTAYGVAEWAACPPCPADFDRSGGVDGADVEAFFLAWEASDGAADVNGDGGVDGGDVEYFFRAWEAGGC